MPKVYIAAAFRKFSTRNRNSREYGELVDVAYVQLLEQIEDVFLDFGFNTCLPHRDEGFWGKVYYDAGAISALCYRHVKTSDVVFALAEGGRGVHIELGYAAGLGGKTMILMHHQNVEPSTLLRGFSEDASHWQGIKKGICEAVTYPYASADELLDKLKKLLAMQYEARKGTEPSKRTNIGIIDIGSHTVKLKILSYRRGGHPRPVHADRKSLGIMGDVIASGALSRETMENLLSLLATWKCDCERIGCDKLLVTGTAALRKASNSDTLAKRIEESLGLAMQIITPEKELDYIFKGVRTTFTTEAPIGVLNLGGGSTQLGIGASTRPDERYMFDFGTRQLTEKWPWKGSMSDQDYNSLLSHVRTLIEKTLSGKRIIKVDKIVHTGGELDFMLKCRLPLVVSHDSSIHVSEISISDFAVFSSQFRQLSPDNVAKQFDLDPAWVAGAVASNAIALSMAEAIGASAIIPSNLNISDGLLTAEVAVPPEA